MLTNDSFVATGSKRGNYSRDCELYSINQDKWSELPQLLEGKSGHSSIGFKQKFVYVFQTDKSGKTCCEKLDVADLERGWYPIYIKPSH